MLAQAAGQVTNMPACGPMQVPPPPLCVQALLGAAAAAAVTGALSLNLVARAVNSEQLLFLEVG